MISTLRRGLLVLLAALPLMANAAGSAHELVQDTTNKMLADLSANKEKYKKDPDQFAAQAYDALKIMAVALEKSGSVNDRKKLRDSLATIKDFPGVTGKFAFDAKRNPAMDVTVLIVKEGQFAELK